MDLRPGWPKSREQWAQLGGGTCAHIDLIKPMFARTLILQGHLECQARPKANEDGRVDTFFFDTDLTRHRSADICLISPPSRTVTASNSTSWITTLRLRDPFLRPLGLALLPCLNRGFPACAGNWSATEAGGRRSRFLGKAVFERHDTAPCRFRSTNFLDSVFQLLDRGMIGLGGVARDVARDMVMNRLLLLPLALPY